MSSKQCFAGIFLFVLSVFPDAFAQPAASPPAAAVGPVRSQRQEIHALRLRPGQDLRVELERFAKSAGLRAGYIITCVGSLNRATLRLANRSETTAFDGKFEIVSLVGTLTPDGPHLHLSISDNTGRTIGGHLIEGCPIYTTAEIVIGEATDLDFTRELDVQSGYEELAVRPRKSKKRSRAKK